MIAIFGAGAFLYNRVSLATHQKADVSRTQRLFKYAIVLQFLRLIRVILRFISAVILVVIAVIGWFCRKRVKKGRLLPP